MGVVKEDQEENHSCVFLSSAFFWGKGGGGRVFANLLIREPPIWEGRRMAGSLFRQTPLGRTSIVTKVKVFDQGDSTSGQGVPVDPSLGGTPPK